MSGVPECRVVDLGAPLRWLRLGWQDFRQLAVPSLMHGLALLVATLVIVAIGFNHAGLLAGAFSGFVLVAPALCFGLYSNSRALERGEVPGLSAFKQAWKHAARPALRAGLLLALVGSVWVLLSSLLVARAGLLTGGVEGYLRLFAGEHGNPFLFWMWLIAGALLAALVFGATAISLPMLIDRDISLGDAVRGSLHAVGNNPVTMVIWAIVIMISVLIAVASVVGLVLIVPILGYASWHAYRELTVSESTSP